LKGANVSKPNSQAAARCDTHTGNLLLDFYDRLPDVISACVDDVAPVRDDAAFSPGFALPELSNAVKEFLSAGAVRWHAVGTYRGRRISILDLAGNPATHTTKTYASLLIVARAAEYIRRTGEHIMIFSPTSANKGVALRDAVLRALRTGIVRAEQLRIVTLVPRSGREKLRADPLSADAGHRALNPVLLYTGTDPEAVKTLGRDFVTRYGATVRRDLGVNVWYSLELRNYLIADTTRAFFEHRVDPPEKTARTRVHAHAVSSAFGLLGYHQGRSLLEDAGEADPRARPSTLLVQHLSTPDMVLSLTRSRVPRYTLDSATALYRQEADPHFPEVTYDPDEVLDPTFYTRRPATSAAMNELIGRFGGDGIVVSLAECVSRYPHLRRLVAEALPLPADFRTLREWSLVMVLTGVFNAIDRGLIGDGQDVVVHGSGSYTSADYYPMERADLTPVGTEADIAGALLG